MSPLEWTMHWPAVSLLLSESNRASEVFGSEVSTQSGVLPVDRRRRRADLRPAARQRHVAEEGHPLAAHRHRHPEKSSATLVETS